MDLESTVRCTEGVRIRAHFREKGDLVMNGKLWAGAVAATMVVAGALAGCQSPLAAPRKEVQLYPGFGNYHRTVTTSSPEAQQWFDQGIQLLYGFNHDEAIRSFEKAAEIDPGCAMAWWGISYASGLHINNPEMTDKQSKRGYEAAAKARAALDNETPEEIALVQAVSVRYQWPAPEDRTPLDEAYADAMAKAWKDFPNDPDIGAWYAEALMDLQPWDLYTAAGEPKGRTEEVVATLEQVMAIAPMHPGANHFYIHATEASNTPERALPAAERLDNLVPGSGHLTHMPSHVYIRTGQYAKSADQNEKAVAADRRYFALAPEPEFYGLYYVHNLHFLAYSAMMECRYDTAIKAARDVEHEIPPAFLNDYVKFADAFMPTTLHVMIRFGRWEDILREEPPPPHRLISLAMYHYARAVALAATNRPAEARGELAAYDKVAAKVDDSWLYGNNTGPEILALARQMMLGEILFREGSFEECFVELRKGVALEENLTYDEPPGWMQPVRHALGALLMSAGEYAEAEQVYRADLERHPNNGWSLLGLQNAMLAQGMRPDDPKLVEVVAAKNAAWARADMKPTSSCFCEPAKWVKVD